MQKAAKEKRDLRASLLASGYTEKELKGKSLTDFRAMPPKPTPAGQDAPESFRLMTKGTQGPTYAEFMTTRPNALAAFKEAQAANPGLTIFLQHRQGADKVWGTWNEVTGQFENIGQAQPPLLPQPTPPVPPAPVPAPPPVPKTYAAGDLVLMDGSRPAKVISAPDATNQCVIRADGEAVDWLIGIDRLSFAPKPKGKRYEPKTPATSAYHQPKRSTCEKPIEVVKRICQANPGKQRKEVLALCVAAGVNPSTAATQYSIWKVK